MTDGDGWTTCDFGHQHWGRYGAAGLLAVAAGGPWVLLQHRATWSHGGDTWGVPGGARTRLETAEQAARRETVEETALDVSLLEVIGMHLADHGVWTYTTFVATAPSRLPVVAERESKDLRWVAVQDVAALPLHPAFGEAWPALQELLPVVP